MRYFVNLLPFLLPLVTGHQTILVHHQTGIAAITATALGYQVSHLSAAKVSSSVSEYSPIKICQNVSIRLKILTFKCGFPSVCEVEIILELD